MTALLDACIETIIEVGYARASAALIAKRAHLSDGALFRHFPTVKDLMAATLDEAGRRQVELYASRIAEFPAEMRTPQAVLSILRDITHNPTNGVIYELMVAARTDRQLRDMLKGKVEAYRKKIFDAAKSVSSIGELETFASDNFEALVTVVINAFDGAAIFQEVLPSPKAMDERRIAVLTALLNAARPIKVNESHMPAVHTD